MAYDTKPLGAELAVSPHRREETVSNCVPDQWFAEGFSDRSECLSRIVALEVLSDFANKNPRCFRIGGFVSHFIGLFFRVSAYPAHWLGVICITEINTPCFQGSGQCRRENVSVLIKK